jgi:hypothetical protein
MLTGALYNVSYRCWTRGRLVLHDDSGRLPRERDLLQVIIARHHRLALRLLLRRGLISRRHFPPTRHLLVTYSLPLENLLWL